MHGLVGHRDMARAAIGVGIDRDRLDAEPPRRLDDPAGDLAAIGDQDLGEHQTAHLGLRLSRKALMPSSASSVTHWLATCSPRMSAAPESCGSAFDLGDQLLDQRLHRRRAELQLRASAATVASSWSASTTWSTRPMRSAVAASNVPPCISSWRATRGPIASIRTGMAMRRQQAVAHRGQAEARRRGGDGEVAGQHQADAAAHRRAVDARDRRLGEIVDRLHRAASWRRRRRGA